MKEVNTLTCFFEEGYPPSRRVCEEGLSLYSTRKVYPSVKSVSLSL